MKLTYTSNWGCPWAKWLAWSCWPLSVGGVLVGVVVNFSHFHLLLQNHWVNFNQTWHKASLGYEDPSLLIWRVPPSSKGRKLRNSENTSIDEFKNSLLQNHRANFNHTWHNASLGEGNSSLFKWRAQRFSKGRYMSLRNIQKTLTKYQNLLQNRWTNFTQIWHKASLD